MYNKLHKMFAEKVGMMRCTKPISGCLKTPAITEWGNTGACSCDLVEAMERDFGRLPAQGSDPKEFNTVWQDVFDQMKGDNEGDYTVKKWFINKDAEHE